MPSGPKLCLESELCIITPHWTQSIRGVHCHAKRDNEKKILFNNLTIEESKDETIYQSIHFYLFDYILRNEHHCVRKDEQH